MRRFGIVLFFIVFQIIVLSTNCAASKHKFAIMPVETVGNISVNQTLGAEEALLNSLLNSQKYIISDREKIKWILNEQALQTSGLTEEDKAVKIGKVLGAEKIIVGKLYSVANNQLRLNIKVLDVETAQIEFMSEQGSVSNNVSDLGRFCAAAIINKYPLLGEILGQDGDEYVVNLGTALKVGSRLFVAEKRVVQDESGEIILQEFRRIGLLEVTQIINDRAKARLRSGDSAVRLIKKGDYVSPEPLPEKKTVVLQKPSFSSVKKGKQLLNDDMETRKYLSPEANNQTAGYRNGKLELDATHLRDVFVHTFYPNSFQPENFILEGEFEYLPTMGNSLNAVTFLIRANGTYPIVEGYQINLASDGRYQVNLLRSGLTFPIVPVQSTPLLNRGEVTNKIRIVAYGSNIDIFINNAFLTGIENEVFDRGNIGLFVRYGGRVAFDNIRLWEAVTELGKQP